MKIYVKTFGDYNPKHFPKRIKKGDAVDLVTNEDINIAGPKAMTLSKNRQYRNVVFSSYRIPLGVGMILPPGITAYVYPRSSNFRNKHILLSNSVCRIDNCYNGDNDEWMFEAIAFDDVHIKKGERICQFEIKPSMWATPWQKLKWLFTRNIEFVQVPHLTTNDRGGFGSTGE